MFNQSLWNPCYFEIFLVWLDHTLYSRNVCKFFSLFVQYKFFYSYKFGLQIQIIYYDLPCSQLLLIYGIFFLSLFHEAKRLSTYVCSQYMACPLYWEMSSLIVGLGILSCASWKHMDNNVTHNFLWSPHSLGTNGVHLRRNCIVSVWRRGN